MAFEFSIPRNEQMVRGIPIGRLDNLERRIGTLEALGSFGQQETPTETVNGVNNTFTFAHTIGLIFWNGQFQILNIDYTVSGLVITCIGDFLAPTGSIVNVYGLASSASSSSSTAGLVPVGGTVGWLKSLTGTPALDASFVECNGQVLSDAASVYNGGTIPNLNASGGGTKRFLRGSTTSGTTGGADTYIPVGTIGVPSATTGYQTGLITGATSNHTHVFTGTSASYLPSYYEVVWIIRIK